MNYKEKSNCIMCGKDIIKKSGRIYCIKCRKEKDKCLSKEDRERRKKKKEFIIN